MKFLCIFLCSLCLLSACTSVPTTSPSLSADPDRAQLEQYLQENMGKEYVEAVFDEEDTTEKRAFVEKNTLFWRKTDGSPVALADYVSSYQRISEQSAIVVHRSTFISLLDIQQGILDTLCNTQDFGDLHRPIQQIRTNGTLLYFSTKDQIYRCFLPTKTVDLLATDNMMRTRPMVEPLTITDVVWASYNPVWLKACYELGSSDNVYNIQSEFYNFYDTQTGKIYTWVPENAMQEYKIEGAKFYYQQRKAESRGHNQ